MSRIDEEYTPEETARRRDAVLKVMLNTKPQRRATSPESPEKRKKAADRPAAARGGRRGKDAPAS
jgi:hypothetical protein